MEKIHAITREKIWQQKKAHQKVTEVEKEVEQIEAGAVVRLPKKPDRVKRNKENIMSGQQSRVESIKKIIDDFTPEEKKEFSRIILKDIKPEVVKVPKIKNKIELQRG